MARTAGQAPPQSDRGAAIPGSNRGACRDRWREGCVAQSRSCTRPGGLDASRERDGEPAGTGSRSARGPSQTYGTGIAMSGPQISCISASQISSRSVIIRESRERAESSFAVASGSALRRALSTPRTAANCSRIFLSSTTFWTGFAAALAFFFTGAFAFGAFAAAFFAGFELLAFGALRFLPELGRRAFATVFLQLSNAVDGV